jgi:small subunit ribosomal protein S17
MSETTDKMVTLTGLVSSSAMDKTIVVTVVRREKHKLYKKYVRRSSKVHAHDETNSCETGDLVTIRSVRPISKTKAWILLSRDKKAD